MKKIVLIFILIFSLSFFCGCEKEKEVEIGDNFIMLSLEQSSKGGMLQSIRFSCNSEFLNEVSASMKEELEFRKNLIKEVEAIRNEFLFSYALKYVKNPIEQYKINQGVILTDVTYQSRGDYVGFDIIFTSTGAWNYYNSSLKNEGKPEENPDNSQDENQGENEDNLQKEPSKVYQDNLFYKRIINKGTFPFSATIQVENEQKIVGQIYKDRFLCAAKGLSFEKKLIENYQPQYIYNYTTIYQKLKSDAQLQYYGSDNKYHHVWIVDEQNLNSQNAMTLSITMINKAWWIFFAMIIPLVTAFILILIIKIKNRKPISKKRIKN